MPDTTPNPGSRVLHQKSSCTKKAKTDRTLKNPQKGGDGSTKKKSTTKTDSISPLLHTQNLPKKAGLWGFPCLSPLGAFRAFSEQVSEFSLAHHSFVCIASGYPAKRASKAKKKKNLGRGKQVRVKKGHQKGPLPNRKVPDAGRPWVPGPTGNKKCRQNPKKGASIAPALEAHPLALTRGEGLGRSPLPTSV